MAPQVGRLPREGKLRLASPGMPSMVRERKKIGEREEEGLTLGVHLSVRGRDRRVVKNVYDT